MVPSDIHSLHQMLDQLADDTAHVLHDGRAEARLLLETVVQERRSSPRKDTDSQIREFMQFYVCTRSLESAIKDGELNEAGDWVMWSLADEILDDQVQELEVGRILGFLNAPVLKAWPQMPDVITVWLADFYYYARRRAAMRNVAESLWGLSRVWFDELAGRILDERAAFLGATLLGWAAQENTELAAELTFVIERLAESQQTPSRSKAILVIALATGTERLSSVAPNVWARFALEHLRAELLPHERLQMMIPILHHHYEDAIFQEALNEIDDIPPRNEVSGSIIVDGLRALDSMPDLATALSTVPLLRSDIDGVVAVLERWYRTNTGNGRIGSQDTILFAPFHSSGFLALGGGKRIHMDLDTQETLRRVVEAANQFSSTSVSVVGADNSLLHVPDRFGVPNEAGAEEYEDALVAAYCPPSVATELAQLSTKGFSQLILNAMAHPVQPVQLKALGRTWPIVTSLQPPLRDRPVRRVAIWSGAGSMSEALEAEAVRTIFEQKGALVEVHQPEVTSVDEFLRVYRDPEYDVIWVMSHGEYDHWAPKNVAIQIGPSKTYILLDHLLEEAPRVDGRRLLVLNVCDGAQFEELGALPRVGFAPALASDNQAVISQMWPVKGWAAAAFGALLADRLAQDLPFFNAFTDVLGTIRCPRNELADHLANAISKRIDLCDRVANSGDDFENFALSGSAAFFQ